MKRIRITGYKSIKDMDLELQPINILIGANGSGKSNFLSFFEFVKSMPSGNTKEYIALKGGADRFLHKGDKETQEIVGELFFETNSYGFTLRNGDDGLIFIKEELAYDGSKTTLQAASKEAYIASSDNYSAPYIRQYFSKLSKYHFHDVGPTSPFNKDSRIDVDGVSLYENGRNIVAFLYTTAHNYPISYRRIVKTIQSVVPQFLDFDLTPNAEGFINLKWRDKYSSSLYRLTDLSDGSIRFIALATLFLQNTLPETVIIDEPELGLHPFAIAKLAGLIKSASSKGVQVIVATQSSDLISHFTPEDIVTVDLVDGESVFKRLDSNDLKIWLDDYTIDYLWKNNIIHTEIKTT